MRDSTIGVRDALRRYISAVPKLRQRKRNILPKRTAQNRSRPTDYRFGTSIAIRTVSGQEKT